MHISTHTPAKRFPTPSARYVEIDPRDEDTIELELTPDQIRELEQAARQAFAQTPGAHPQPVPQAPVISTPQLPAVQAVVPIIVMPPVTPVTPSSTAISPATKRAIGASRRTRRSLWVLAIVISVPALIAAAMIHLSASHSSTQPSESPRAIERTPLPPASSTRVSLSPAKTSGPAIASPPVTFANPFDRSEVFEFPAGTAREDARDAVAQILLERAHERRNRTKTSVEVR